jgi:site-specific DNA recombinase
MKLPKINDLSKSPMRERFAQIETTSATNLLTVTMGRVSTKRQKGGAHFSDQEQNDTMDDYCDAEGLKVLKRWDVAEGASDHERRHHFHELLKYVHESQESKNRIGNVFFSHESRSNRNRQSARALEELIDLGVTIHFARNGKKLASQSDLAAWLTWHLENFKNQQYIVEHRQNVWGGMMKRVEIGLFPGKAPFGYKNHRPSKDDLSTFIFVPGPDAYMKKAFELFASGSYTETRLHAELENSFCHLPKRPGLKRFSELLRNPFYYGDFIFDGELHHGNPDCHPPLISQSLWARVQDVLTGRYRTRTSKKAHPYLGLIRCGGHLLGAAGEIGQVCDAAVTAEEQRKRLVDGSVKLHNYYRCSRNKADGKCSQRDKIFMRQVGRGINYTEAEVEILFEAVFRPLSFTPEVCLWMQNVLRMEHVEKSGDHRDQVAALQRQCQMIQGYMNRCYEDKLSGDLTQEEWRDKNQRWKQQLAEAKMKIETLDTDKENYIEKGVLLIELAQRTEHIYKNGNADVKRKLISAVSSNHVLRNGTIEFSYLMPFDILAKSTPKENWWT